MVNAVSSASGPIPLAFQPSAIGSVGIEIELPILDGETGALLAGAKRLLQTCADEGVEGVAAELMQSMLEVRAGPCSNVQELKDALLPRLRKLRNIATSMGYDFALLGTHPFQRALDNAVFPDARFETAYLKLVWLTYYRVTFGLHIHVGVGGGDQAIGIMNQVTPQLPHLVALSGNSPFWQGVDTGFASCRTALYALIPHAGIPPRLSRWKDFRAYVNVMRDCGALTSIKDVKWDIRPRPDFGTLEFRVCDAPHSLERVLALAALVRNLVIAAHRLLESRPRAGTGDSRRQWIAVENRWLASRYGLDAIYIRTPAGKRGPLARDLEVVLDRIRPIAGESGDDRYLATLRTPGRIETGAAIQRSLYREIGNWTTVMRQRAECLAEEIEAGMPKPSATAGEPKGRLIVSR